MTGIEDDSVNEVRLVGRVSGAALERTLPSGDVVVQVRLVVPRTSRMTSSRQRAPRATVDTIDLACWRAGVRRKALRLSEGAQVEVRGALRRRFWRTPAGPASRYEVEVEELTTGKRAPGSTGTATPRRRSRTMSG